MAFLTNKNVERHFPFLITSIFLRAKNHYIIIIISSDTSIVVDFQNSYNFLFVKQLSKTLVEFLCKHAWTENPWKRWILPRFVKPERLERTFNMSLGETKPKIKIDHTFVCVWCPRDKLYNSFDEAFLFDFSIQISPRKKLFYLVHSAKKIVKGEILRRKLREISRKFTQGIFLLSEFSRRHSVKLAEKHREITWSFSAKFCAVTPRKLAEAFKEETFTATLMNYFNVNSELKVSQLPIKCMPNEHFHLIYLDQSIFNLRDVVCSNSFFNLW